MSAASLSANHNYLNHQSINQSSLIHHASSSSINSAAAAYLHQNASIINHQLNGQLNGQTNDLQAHTATTNQLAHVQNLSNQLISQELTSSLSNNSLSGSGSANNNAIIKTAHPYFGPSNGGNDVAGMPDVQPTPDRPIGYGAFGVVWAVTDPRDNKRVALKKMPNVFQNLISAKRVYREVKMLCFFHHENILSAVS